MSRLRTNRLPSFQQSSSFQQRGKFYGLPSRRSYFLSSYFIRGWLHSPRYNAIVKKFLPILVFSKGIDGGVGLFITPLLKEYDTRYKILPCLKFLPRESPSLPFLISFLSAENLDQKYNDSINPSSLSKINNTLEKLAAPSLFFHELAGKQSEGGQETRDETAGFNFGRLHPRRAIGTIPKSWLGCYRRDKSELRVNSQ